MSMQKENTHTQREVTGKLTLTKKGIGYVVSDNHDGDIEIAQEFLGTALHGDIVTARIHAKINNGKETGEITDIIRRSKRGFAGTLKHTDEIYWVAPDDRKMNYDIVVPEKKLMGAQPGEKVFVTIVRWDDRRDPPVGRIEVRLGQPQEHEAEMQAIALEQGFTSTFPKHIEEEAQHLYERGITQEEIETRRDMREYLTCTIDPADAKDFDDALSVHTRDDGITEVGIHIADVAYYVTEGSAIDKEAYDRATSVYLVDRTIPMLPETLSNDLCSLRPNEDRLAFSVILSLDTNHEIVDAWYGRTVINSDHRLAYEDAQTALESDGTQPLEKALQYLNTVAKKYQQKRFKNGALNVDQDEVKFKLNEAGEPVDVFIKERQDAHHMIEEWMLLANTHIARFGAGPQAQSPWKNNNPLARAQGEREGAQSDRTFLYRVHGLPDREKMKELATFLEKVGFSVDIEEGRIPPKELNQITQELEGHPEKNAIETMMIRTMAKAIYDVTNIGHYGLAFPFYTHFTSPIRRYPDLVVHRMIAKQLAGEKTPRQEFGRYRKLAEHCSERERDAQNAERSSVKYKQVEYMSKHIGETFEGVITNVTGWGIYVEETRTKAEGLVHVSNLDDDYYTLDEKTLTLVGSDHGREFRIGQVIPITVKNTNIDEKLIDYELASKEG